MVSTHRTARIEARISQEGLTAVREAAALQGRSISDFVVAAAQDAAQRTIAEARMIRLSIDDQIRFAEAIIDPPALAPAMERALTVHRAMILSSES